MAVSKQTRAVLVVMLVMVLVGCRSKNAPATPAPAPQMEEAAEPVATLERSGGFAPVEVLFTLWRDGGYGLQIHRGAEAQAMAGSLEGARLKAVRDAVAATEAFKEVAYDAAANDDRRYVLKHAGRTIRWSEAYNPLPPPLRELEQLLDQMVSQASAQRPPAP
jgi:hypothetical protein